MERTSNQSVEDIKIRIEAEAMHEVLLNIRDAQRLSSEALGKLATHEAKCDGRYRVIEVQLSALLWLLGGIAAGLGSVFAAYATKHWIG